METWTPDLDRRMLSHLARDRHHPERVAAKLGVTLVELQRRVAILVPPTDEEEERSTKALPAGHELSWRLITAGTLLEGSPLAPAEERVLAAVERQRVRG
jgi:hypothetical protein